MEPAAYRILAEKHRVLAPEHPGFGRSQIPDWMMGIGDLAYFYLDFIEKLDLENVHLVGHSLGGWTAAEIAVRNTSRLKSLTCWRRRACARPMCPSATFSSGRRKSMRGTCSTTRNSSMSG